MGKYLENRQKTSGNIAKIRLEQTLASDYLECNMEILMMMQNEILEILSRYMTIHEEDEIQLRVIQKIKQGEPYVKTIQIKGL